MTRHLRLTAGGFAPSKHGYSDRWPRTMRHFPRRTVLILPAAVLLWILSALPAEAAWPRLLLVYGPPLTRPVVLADSQENETLMLAATDTATISGDQLKGRPYVRLAFFWGPEWAQYVSRAASIQRSVVKVPFSPLMTARALPMSVGSTSRACLC